MFIPFAGFRGFTSTAIIYHPYGVLTSEDLTIAINQLSIVNCEL